MIKKYTVITGAGGFIAGKLIEKLLSQDITKKLLFVDNWSSDVKNLKTSHFIGEKIDRTDFIKWFNENSHMVECVIHLGARTDTHERNEKVFNELNYDYSVSVYDICSNANIPMIFASSAAIYGDGTQGYGKNEIASKKILNYTNLNPYAKSKLDFEIYAKSSIKKPLAFIALRFFNVYGYGEHHKGKMASMVTQGIKDIMEHGRVVLFKSDNREIRRDFVSVDDVVRVIMTYYDSFITYYYVRDNVGKIILPNYFYNVGTSRSRTYEELMHCLFLNLRKPIKIEYIPLPLDKYPNYQYHTVAFANAQQNNYMCIEDGVKNYVNLYMKYGFDN